MSEPLSPCLLPIQNAGYDEETAQVMKRVLRPDSCCIDVGAHEGIILKDMVRLAPAGIHFAFEPLPHLANQLRNRFANVRVHEAAVSDQAGAAMFIHVENDPGYSGLRERIYDRPDPVLREISVNVVRLDDVIPVEVSIGFIKIDIEGAEYHALLGAEQTIQRGRPVIVFEAGAKSTGQYGVTPVELFRLLTEQFGYHLSTMCRWLAGVTPYSETEFCFNWSNGPDFFFLAYPRGKDSLSKLESLP